MITSQSLPSFGTDVHPTHNPSFTVSAFVVSLRFKDLVASAMKYWVSLSITLTHRQRCRLSDCAQVADLIMARPALSRMAHNCANAVKV